MAVQAQLYSDYYHNNNMGCSNEHLHDQGLIENQKIMSFGSGYHQNIVSSSNSRRNGIIGSHNLSSELERQRLEMNCFLHLQNEKLKAVLKEETRKREAIVMQSYESKMKAIINEKDAVLNTATIRTKKLQTYLQMAEQEAKIWEKKAIESEAIVTDLNTKLIKVKAKTHEDAESVCNGNNNDEEQRQEKMVCKMCHVRSTCMLLLPCKHLCCCRHCEELIGGCRKASKMLFSIIFLHLNFSTRHTSAPGYGTQVKKRPQKRYPVIDFKNRSRNGRINALGRPRRRFRPLCVSGTWYGTS